MRGAPSERRSLSSSPRSRKAQGEPALRVPIQENARRIGINPDELFADSMGAVDAAEQLLELVVGNRFLEFRERLPVWRISQGIAEVIRGASTEAEQKGDGEDKWKAEDHRLDFGLFNTMLARC